MYVLLNKLRLYFIANATYSRYSRRKYIIKDIQDVYGSMISSIKESINYRRNGNILNVYLIAYKHAFLMKALNLLSTRGKLHHARGDKEASHESGFVCTTRLSRIRRALFNGGLISESKDIRAVYRLSKNKL